MIKKIVEKLLFLYANEILLDEHEIEINIFN